MNGNEPRHNQILPKAAAQDVSETVCGGKNILHTKAYKLAEKHFIEAMEIELQPKQRNAVIDRTKRIREEWDGIYEVSIE